MPTEPRYLLVAELVHEPRFDVTAPRNPQKACYEWLARHAVPIRRRGRVILVERRAVDAALERDA